MAVITGKAVESFMLDNETGAATEIKEFVTEIHMGKSNNAVDDTRVGDAATRMRNLKPTYSMTVSVRPDHTLVPVFYGAQSEDEKDLTLTYDADGSGNGIKVVGKVKITDVPDIGFMRNGDGPDVQVTLAASDGNRWTITNTGV